MTKLYILKQTFVLGHSCHVMLLIITSFLIQLDALPFISKWQITFDDLTLTLPLVFEGTYAFTVNWGDGSGDDIVSAFDQAEVTHVYSTANNYTLTIDGTLIGFSFDNEGDKFKLIEISQW